MVYGPKGIVTHMEITELIEMKYDVNVPTITTPLRCPNFVRETIFIYLFNNCFSI